MDVALKRLLDAFDAIGETHGEVFDTMVRELTGGRIYRAFVLAEPEAEAPASYGLFEPEGNAAVGAALDAFLADPAVVAMTASATPLQRLAAFQNGDVLSTGGVPYDEYFGHYDGLG